MVLLSCEKPVSHDINNMQTSVRSTSAMSALKKTAIGLSLIALSVFGAKAQNANDNALAFNEKAKSGVLTKKNLTSPVVIEAESSYEGETASYDKNISVVIYHAKTDQISGNRYANGFAKGFTSAEKTNGKPIYATASFIPEARDNGTLVVFYMNGDIWSYKGKDSFSPSTAGKLLPIFMDDYVTKFGNGKILPLTTLASSLDR